MTTNVQMLWDAYDETEDQRTIREANERIDYHRLRESFPEIEPHSADAGDARYAELVDQLLREVGRRGRKATAGIVEEMARLEAEKKGAPPFGHVVQLGRRFAESARYRAFRDFGSPGMSVSVPVLAEHEIAAYLAALNTDPGPLATTGLYPNVQPLPAPIASLVTTVPAENAIARRVNVDPNMTGVYGGTPTGGVPSLVPATVEDLDRDLFRWVVDAKITRSQLEDSVTAARVVDELMRRVWARTLDVELLAGNGSTVGARRQLNGILGTPGIGSLAGPISVAKVLTAVQTLTTAGFAGPHDLVGPPAMLTTLLGAADWRADRFPTLRSVTYVDHASVAVLGQWSEASLFVRGPVTVDVSPDNESDFLRGLYVLQPTAELEFDVPRPSAFVKIAAA